MSDSIYVPVLKGKQGELDALQNTQPEIRRRLTPLLEVPPIPPRYIEGQEEPVPSKTIDDHIDQTALKFATAWGQEDMIFVDGQYIEGEDQLNDGMEPIAGFLRNLRQVGTQAVPVTGLDRVQEYQDAIRSAIQEDGRGVCLRLTEADLEALADLEQQVSSLLEFLAVQAESVDLLLDFGPNVPSRAAAPYLLNAVPMISRWRTFSLASSGFPADMSQVRQNSVVELTRREWTVWTHLFAQRRAVKRLPRFSDYAINHPALFEIDPRVMRMSPNIRYTAELNFVLARGEAYRRRNEPRASVPPEVQYRRLSKQIIDHPSWQGEDYSWGDKFIADCDRGKHVGNPTNWRAVGTSHHLAFAVRQLASLL